MSSEQRWIIKTAKGNITGPYTTKQIIKRISRGEYSGAELIASFPGNDWFPISKDPTFYDQLLKVLESESGLSEGGDDKTWGSESIEESVGQESIFEEPTAHELVEQNDQVEKVKRGRVTRVNKKYKLEEVSEEDESEDNDFSFKKHTKIEKESFTDDSVLELEIKDKVVKKTKIKKARVPFIAIIVVLIAAVGFLLLPSGSKNFVKLILPKFSQGEALTKEQMNAKFKNAFSSFSKDDFNGYLKSQNYLVQILESNAGVKEGYSLLCLTYMQLWPFAQKDSRDLDVISKVMQKATKVNPSGIHSKVCNVVDLYLKGQLTEANGVVNSVLDSFSSTERPPVEFYYLKSILLMQEKQYEIALNYVSSAQQLWKTWLKLYVLEADLYFRINRFARSAKRLRQVLKVNPNHRAAKIILGLIEYRNLKNYERGRALLEEGVASKGKIERSILAKGYYGLSLVALYDQDRKLALKHVKECYSIYPRDLECYNLLKQLGGEKALNNVVVKERYLMLEGDQYNRVSDYNSAQALYKAAYQANKKNGLAALKAGEVLWKLGLTTEAIEWTNKAIQADQNLVDAYTRLSDFYSQKYNYKAAAKVLGRARQQFKTNYKILRGYALIELRRRNARGAIHFAEKSLKIYETDIESLILIAKAYVILGDAKAFVSASKALEVDSNNREAQVIYAKAMAKAQGMQSAINYMIQLVNQYPQIVEYRTALGELYFEDQRYGQAEQVVRDGIDIERKNKNAFILLGDIYKFQNRLKESARAYNRASIIDPSDGKPLFKSGILYLEAKKYTDARVFFESVLRVNKHYPLVHYYMGKTELKLNLPQEALKQAALEQEKNPKLAEPYLLSAEAYLHMKQYLQCAGEYQKALNIRNVNSDIYIKIARCNHLAGNVEAALDMLNLAKQVESGNPLIYRELGAIYERVRENDKAVTAYERYLLLYPAAPDRGVVQQRIDILSR